MSEQTLDNLARNLHLDHQVHNVEIHTDAFPEWFKSFEKQNPEQAAIIKNAKKILDLGSGTGYSSRGFLEVCSGAEEVTTVDRKQSADLSDKKVRHEHILKDMNSYLESAPDNSADIVIIFSVPGDFVNEGMYDHLKRVLKDGGSVITFDTTLIDGGGRKVPLGIPQDMFNRQHPQRNLMESRFKAISDPESEFYRVWLNTKD